MKIDALGRLTIPVEIRKQKAIGLKEKMEVKFSYGAIHITKFNEQGYEKRPYIGLVRELDNLYRITIPREFLLFANIPLKSEVYVILEGDEIIIQKN